MLGVGWIKDVSIIVTFPYLSEEEKSLVVNSLDVCFGSEILELKTEVLFLFIIVNDGENVLSIDESDVIKISTVESKFDCMVTLFVESMLVACIVSGVLIVVEL